MERHIEEQVRLGGGYFNLTWNRGKILTFANVMLTEKFVPIIILDKRRCDISEAKTIIQKRFIAAKEAA